MSARALIILLALGLSVAGCATGPVNSLTQDKRDSLRIDSVEVSFTNDATIQWPDARGAPEEPDARLAFLKQKAIAPIKAALDAEIPAAFRGTNPATLKVRIRKVNIPAAATHILIATVPYAIVSDMELVDGGTGKTLLSASNFNAFSQSYGGVAGILETAIADDPIIRVSKAYAHVLSIWLKTGRKQAMG